MTQLLHEKKSILEDANGNMQSVNYTYTAQCLLNHALWLCVSQGLQDANKKDKFI